MSFQYNRYDLSNWVIHFVHARNIEGLDKNADLRPSVMRAFAHGYSKTTLHFDIDKVNRL